VGSALSVVTRTIGVTSDCLEWKNAAEQRCWRLSMNDCGIFVQHALTGVELLADGYQVRVYGLVSGVTWARLKFLPSDSISNIASQLSIYLVSGTRA